MSRHTKDRRKKQKEKLETAVKEERISFDVLALLASEKTDTKPNMGKFLKAYVKEIRGLIPNGKISFYPMFEYSVSRTFVRFLDGHEFVWDMSKEKPEDAYFFYSGTDELPLTQKGYSALKEFFVRLLEFGFVFDAASPTGTRCRKGCITYNIQIEDIGSDEDIGRDSQVPGIET